MAVNKHVARFGQFLRSKKRIPTFFFPERPIMARKATGIVVAALVILMSVTGCSNRMLVPAGAEPSAALSDGSTYGFVWRSTTRRNHNFIMGSTVAFGVASTSPQQISTVAGAQPRLVRVSSTLFFAAWKEGDSVYGRYLNAPSMTLLDPADPPLELNSGVSGGLIGFDIAYSESENRVLLVTGRPGGNIYLYEIRRTTSGSPPFTSTRVSTLRPSRTTARVPRIAVGQPGGSVVILVTAAPTLEYHIVRPGGATSRYDLDPAVGMRGASDHRCVYDPVHQRFLEVLGDGNQIYSAIIYPDGSHGRNTLLSLPDFSPTAPPTVDDGGETFTQFRIAGLRITFEDVAPTGRSSGSVFSLAYSEYHQVVATTYRRYSGSGGRPPPPPSPVGTSVTHYETVYTQGLDALGQATGSRIARGPTGHRSDERKVEAALSPEAATHHAIIIGSDIAQHVERYLQP